MKRVQGIGLQNSNRFCFVYYSHSPDKNHRFLVTKPQLSEQHTPVIIIYSPALTDFLRLNQHNRHFLIQLQIKMVIIQNVGLMKTLQQPHNPRKISSKRRAQLIKGVLHQGKSIIYITKKLRLNYTTARMIINQEIRNGVSESRQIEDGQNLATIRPQSQNSQQLLTDNVNAQSENNYSKNPCFYQTWVNPPYSGQQLSTPVYFYPFCPFLW